MTDNFEKYLIYATCYSIMFIITWMCKRSKSNRLFDTKGSLAVNAGNLVGLHVAGIIWFGLVPLIFSKQPFKSILLGSEIPALIWVFSLLLLLIIITITGIRASRTIQINNENIRFSFGKIILCYFPARILFLCSYELFFRGFLIFEEKELFGLVPAIALSTALTVLIHVFTNKKEMWGCIPFGIILCGCSVIFNAVWPAIVLHIALSLSYELPPSYQFFKPVKLMK